jgi:hypothetical protein
VIATPSLGQSTAVGAVTLLLAGAVAAAQTLDAVPSRANTTHRRAWSAVAGGLTALAAVPAARALASATGLDRDWLLGLVPALAALALLVTAVLAGTTTRTTPRPAAVAAGAGAVTAAAGLFAGAGRARRCRVRRGPRRAPVAGRAGHRARRRRDGRRRPTPPTAVTDGRIWAAAVLALAAVTLAAGAGDRPRRPPVGARRAPAAPRPRRSRRRGAGAQPPRWRRA